MTHFKFVKAVEDFRNTEEVDVKPELLCELLKPKVIKHEELPARSYHGVFKLESEEV